MRRSSRRIGRIALVGLAAALLCGCLEHRQKTVLDRDGSGWVGATATLDVGARDDLLRRLARLWGATEDPERLPFADPFHPRWVRTLAEGVRGFTLAHAERTENDGKRTTMISAQFENLRAAAEAGVFFSASLSLEKEESGEAWLLEMEDVWADLLTREEGEIGGRPAREVIEALKEPLAGLTLERIFVLPTKVTETNGRLELDGRTVRWTTDLAHLQKREGLVLRITFEHAEGLELSKFAFRPDPDALVRRVLEAPPR